MANTFVNKKVDLAKLITGEKDEFSDIKEHRAELSEEQQKILNRPDIKWSYDEDPKEL